MPAGTVNVPVLVNTCMLEKPPPGVCQAPSPRKNVDALGVPDALRSAIGILLVLSSSIAISADLVMSHTLHDVDEPGVRFKCDKFVALARSPV
jgi:hypothetical protein